MRRGEHLHAKRADPTEALGIVLERRRTVRWHPRACEPSALQGLSSRAPITTNHSFAQFSVGINVCSRIFRGYPLLGLLRFPKPLP